MDPWDNNWDRAQFHCSVCYLIQELACANSLVSMEELLFSDSPGPREGLMTPELFGKALLCRRRRCSENLLGVAVDSQVPSAENVSFQQQ